MEEIDLKEVIVALWNKKMFIIITTIIFILISFLILGTDSLNNLFKNITNTQDIETLYYAETHFIVGTSETTHTEYDLFDTSPITITGESRVIQTDSLSQTYFEIIKSRTSLNKIIDELQLDIDTNTLSNLISFSRVSESDFLSITVAYKDETKIIQIANKLMDEFIMNMEKAYPIDQVSVIDEAYLLSSTDIANSRSASSIVTTTYISKAAFKHSLTCITIAAILGIIVSAGIVLMIELFDDTIKNEEYLEKDSLLAKIKKNKTDNKNKFAILKIRLAEFKTLLVTSPDADTDITYISNSLATSFANSNTRVLLLDLNSNKSELVEEYNGKGLLNYISNKDTDIKHYISKSTVDNLDVLLIGSGDGIYLEEKQLKELLNALENTYDTIIINSKNILNEPNALSTSKVVKNTLLVATQRKTKLSEFNRVQTVLKEIDGNVVGNILINHNE